MSGLPGRLDSGRGGSGARGCGGTLAEGAAGLEAPELWAQEERGPRGAEEDVPRGPPGDGRPPRVTRAPQFPASSSPPTLANGLHLHRTPTGQFARRRRQPDASVPPATETQPPADGLRSMQSSSHTDLAARPQAGAPLANKDSNGVRGVHTGTDTHTAPLATLEKPRTLSPPETHRLTSSAAPPTLPLTLDVPAASANEPAAAPVLTAETDIPSTYSPAPVNSNPPPPPGSSPLPVEAERKYALRSSGRPRFPCHLRKSSRLRRSTEDGERRGGGREREGGQQQEEEEEEEEVLMEEKVWRVREEEVAAVVKEEKQEQPCVPSALPAAAPCPAELPSAVSVPHKPAPKSMSKPRPKPGPKLCPKPGPKPGPRSRSRPGAPKSAHRAGPKSKQLQQPSHHHPLHPHPVPHQRPGPRPAFPTPHFPTNAAMMHHQPVVKKEEPLGAEVSTPTKRRYVGVRRLVVKVARIPVNLSRRQKSYKISNMETTHFAGGAEKKKCGGEKGGVGAEGAEGTAAPREPTALLRMKNNGKSVMVMFPPGELPVILKRRRGRPPKQPLPGLPGLEALNVVNAGAGAVGGNVGDPPKKPRRRRLTKLPSPYPSYVNDTDDVKMEYGDVLSKLAFLNRQPPATGRCSPPRCWTPSEPESFNTPSENPGISTLLHKLTGFRRRGGGRGGGPGSRRGAAGAGGAGAAGRAADKSTFSDFFESIGKKRKLSPHSETGLPRKRGKGGRGGGVVGSEPGMEKPVRKRRPRKNGTFKGEASAAAQDWPNGAGGWGEEGSLEKALGGYQTCGSPRGGFSREGGRGGAYGSPGGGRGGVGGAGGEDSQGLFAGYFRSLLDSDDSSDLLDIGPSQGDPRKAPSTPGYEPSSPAPGPCWSPAFSKRSPKGSVSGTDGPAHQTHGGSSSTARPPYYSSLAQTSPTTPTYPPKSTPPSLSLSRSPSSPHPSSYGHYSPGFSSSSPVGGGAGAAATQRSADCSFSYGSGHAAGGGKNNNIPVGQGQMNYSSYQVAAAKRGFGGYPGSAHSSMGGRGESVGGPTSPGGGGYMAMAKTSPFSPSPSPEGYKQYISNQWNYRHGYGGWAADSFGSQYHHGYGEYGSNESKDILDISNYTPQKAKRQPFPESLSESSSDSSHLGPVAASCGPGSGSGGGSGGGGAYKQKESAPVGGGGESGQSSLSSLEKLMMDWHESAAGPSYNWSQNVLFQGGAAAGGSTTKQGRGRRKRAAAEPPPVDKEGSAAAAPHHGGGPPSDSPSSPSPTPTPGPKRGAGGRPRGTRGGRGGLSPCQRERGGARARAKGASAASGGVGGSGTPPGLFQEGLDYYSGDSSSLSPLATPSTAPPGAGYPPDPCEYPSPYSAHPSTPSSEERYPAVYPGESSSSLSPGVSSPPAYPPKPPPQTYHPVPSRTFSPSCSPSPRLTPHCGTALSPPHRPLPQKEPQYPQYDSPSYCGSPYWYGQTSHGGSPGPHAGAAQHTHPNPHASPNPNLPSPHANTHAHVNPGANPLNSAPTHHSTQQQPHPNMSPHSSNAPPQQQQQQHAGPHQLQGSPQAHTNPNSHPHSHPHPHPHHNAHANPQQLHGHSSHPGGGLHSHHLYDERPSPHKREQLTPHHMSTGLRQGPLSPYAKSPLDNTSPHHHQDELGGGGGGYPYQGGMGHRYPPQVARGGGGVLCQLLDPASDDSFSVTSL